MKFKVRTVELVFDGGEFEIDLAQGESILSVEWARSTVRVTIIAEPLYEIRYYCGGRVAGPMTWNEVEGFYEQGFSSMQNFAVPYDPEYNEPFPQGYRGPRASMVGHP